MNVEVKGGPPPVKGISVLDMQCGKVYVSCGPYRKGGLVVRASGEIAYLGSAGSTGGGWDRCNGTVDLTVRELLPGEQVIIENK